MAGVKLSPQDLEGATEVAPVRLSPEELAGAQDISVTPTATPKPSLLDRARGTISGIGSSIVGAGRALGTTFAHPLETLENPARRRQMERGLDDMVTLGYGQKLAKKVGDWTGDASFGDEQAAKDAAEAPEFRQLGNVAGIFTPGVTGKIAKEGGAFINALSSGIAAPTTALGRAALAGGKSIAGYEATAPALAGLSANASGHRLEAAGEAATDPVGLGMSTVAGLANGRSEGLAPEVQRRLGLPANDTRSSLIEGAKVRATKDIARDIVSAEGPKAKATDQLRIKETSDRLFKLTQENPELRKVWRESARKALPDIAEAKRVAARPLDGKYEAVDQLTGGGIKLGTILDGFDAAAEEAAKNASGQPQAARIRAVRDNFLKAYGKPGFDPTADIDGVPAGEVVKRLELARGTPGVADQIAQVKEIASGVIDRDMRIPTAKFRQEVTDLHKTAEDVLGQIEGTPKHQALSHLYEIGKGIIDKHLDESGLPATDLKELRKANDNYFLLSRAEAAIESRGIKEENRNTGFHLPRSASGALNMGMMGAVPFAVANPHHIPHLLAAYGLGHALPAIRSRIDWKLANMGPAMGPRPSLLPPLAPIAPQLGQPPAVDGANLAAALSASKQQP